MAEKLIDRSNEYIRIEGVTKRFGDFVAVDNVSLNVYKGEIFCLLGGSGCGKTTLLRMLAGFEAPTSSTVRTWPTSRLTSGPST
jgi:putrescine transport system ATP-binding protein